MTLFNCFKKFSTVVLLLVILGCSNDDYLGEEDFVVAFENSSEDYSGQEESKTIDLVFSFPAPKDGEISIVYNSESLTYGVFGDFTSSPEITDGEITIPFSRGSEQASFNLFKQSEVLPGEEKAVQFDIAGVEIQVPAYAQGNTTLQVNFSETASLGGSIAPEVGGPNQPNQVYVSLASRAQAKIRRDIWDFGFYSGDEFYVKLNSSLYMFAGSLETTDMNTIDMDLVSGLKNKMNFLVEDSHHFVDHPNGKLDQLALHEIKENDEENPVYLIKMGNEIGTDNPSAGSVAVAGEERGWKKIRILRQGEGYRLQYANINDTDYQEVTIAKNPTHNFAFYSMTSENLVEVEPKSENWDLNFTVNVEIEYLPGTNVQTAYGYSDYVQTNTLVGVEAYSVSIDQNSYEDFDDSNIDHSQFEKNQQIIGSSWRNTVSPNRGVFGDKFYVVKDANDNFYKLKFTTMENENGVRGFPEFKYELL